MSARALPLLSLTACVLTAPPVVAPPPAQPADTATCPVRRSDVVIVPYAPQDPPVPVYGPDGEQLPPGMWVWVNDFGVAYGDLADAHRAGIDVRAEVARRRVEEGRYGEVFRARTRAAIEASHTPDRQYGSLAFSAFIRLKRGNTEAARQRASMAQEVLGVSDEARARHEAFLESVMRIGTPAPATALAQLAPDVRTRCELEGCFVVGTERVRAQVASAFPGAIIVLDPPTGEPAVFGGGSPHQPGFLVSDATTIRWIGRVTTYPGWAAVAR